MAKNLVFSIDEKEHAFSVSKLDRKKMYGWKEQLALDSDSQPCVKAEIDESGAFIIPGGGKALGVIDDQGQWVNKKDLIATNKSDGSAAELIPSSFDHTIELGKSVSIDEFLDHNIESVYMLECEDSYQGLIDLVKKNHEVYTFTFNYRTDYEGSNAFLLESKDRLFILTGYASAFEFLSLEQVSDVTVEEDDDEEFSLEDDLDFGMM